MDETKLEDELYEFKNDIIEQNRLIGSNLVMLSNILEDLKTELEAIYSALIKE